MITIHSRNGDHAAAVDSCRRLLESQPADADTLIVLGDEKWGIAVTKADVLEAHAKHVFDLMNGGDRHDP